MKKQNNERIESLKVFDSPLGETFIKNVVCTGTVSDND